MLSNQSRSIQTHTCYPEPPNSSSMVAPTSTSKSTAISSIQVGNQQGRAPRTVASSSNDHSSRTARTLKASTTSRQLTTSQRNLFAHRTRSSLVSRSQTLPTMRLRLMLSNLPNQQLNRISRPPRIRHLARHLRQRNQLKPSAKHPTKVPLTQPKLRPPKLPKRRQPPMRDPPQPRTKSKGRKQVRQLHHLSQNSQLSHKPQRRLKPRRRARDLRRLRISRNRLQPRSQRPTLQALPLEKSK